MTHRRSNDRTLPAEFLKLGLHFHQDIDRDVETRADLARRLVGGFCDAERPVLRAYLDELVQSASAEDLVGLWQATPSDWFATDGEELRRLFAEIRDLLGQGRTRPGWRPVGEGRNHAKRVRLRNAKFR